MRVTMAAKNEDDLRNSDSNPPSTIPEGNDCKSSEPSNKSSEGIDSLTSDGMNANVEAQQLIPEKENVDEKACKSAETPADTEGKEEVECRKSKKEVHLVEKLNSLNCPFVWQADLHIDTYGDHDFDLLADAQEMFEETGFRFRGFIVSLVLCYHNFYKRLIRECFRNLEELEKMLSFTSKSDSQDFLFNTINDALYHVVHSCRLHIMIYTDPKNKQMLSKIAPYKTMNDANKAGIWGIRASVYVEYGYEGVVAAVDYIEKAIQLDPTNAYWPFLKGTYLGRLRRMVSGLIMPTVEELTASETAVRMREDPTFLAFNAEAYLEMAKIGRKLYREKFSSSVGEVVEKLLGKLDLCNQKAVDYFKRSIELKPNCAHLLFRCGKGLMRLPPPYQNLEEAEHYLRQGLTLAPKSSFGHHAMAMFCEKFKKDPKEAQKHLTVSVNRKNYQAHMDACRIRFLETENEEELIAELKDTLDLYPDLPKHRKILGEIVCYYLFLDYDLVEACVHLRSLANMRNKFSDVQILKFKSGILPFSGLIPLLDLVLSEIGHRYRQKDFSEEEKNVYKKFINFLLTENISVPDHIPKNLLPGYAADLQKNLKRLKNLSKSSQPRDSKEPAVFENRNKKSDREQSRGHEYLKYYREREDASGPGFSRLISKMSKSDDSDGAQADQVFSRRGAASDKSKKTYGKKYCSGESDDDGDSGAKRKSEKHGRRDERKSRRRRSSDDSSPLSDSGSDYRSEQKKRERDRQHGNLSTGRSHNRQTDETKVAAKKMKSSSDGTAEKLLDETLRKLTLNDDEAVAVEDTSPLSKDVPNSAEDTNPEGARKQSQQVRSDNEHAAKKKRRGSRGRLRSGSSEDSGRSCDRRGDRERTRRYVRDEYRRRKGRREDDYDRSDRSSSRGRRSDCERDERRRGEKHADRYYQREKHSRRYRRKRSTSPSDSESSESSRASSRRSRK